MSTSNLSGQVTPGFINFGTATPDPVTGMWKVPVLWTDYTIAPQIFLLDLNINESNACIDQVATKNSRNPIFAAGDITISSAGNIKISRTNITLPAAPLTLFTIFVVGDNLPTAISLSVGMCNFLISGTPAFTVQPGPTSPKSVAVSANLQGFIERPGNPAPNCQNSANGAITQVAITAEELSGNACIFLPTNNGTGSTGNYTQRVHRNFDYRIRPQKLNGNACGLTSYDVNLIQAHFQGLTLFTTLQEYIAADMDLSNNLQLYDALQINKVIAGIFVPVSGYTSWVFAPTFSYTLATLPPLGDSGPIPILPNDLTVSDVPAGNLTGLNFIGVKKGDVNQSCTTCNQANFGGSSSEDRSIDFTNHIYIDSRPIHAGEHLSVPVRVSNFHPTSSFSVGIGFDPQKIRVTAAEAGDLPIGLGAMTVNDTSSIVKYAWASDKKEDYVLEKGSSLMNLNIEVLEDAASLSDLFRLDETEIRNELYYNLREKGQFMMGQPTDKASLSCFPNPFSEAVTITYNLPVANTVHICVCDMLGRVIQYFDTEAHQGSQTWQVSTANMPTGMYLCRLQSNGIEQSIKIVKH